VATVPLDLLGKELGAAETAVTAALLTDVEQLKTVTVETPVPAAAAAEVAAEVTGAELAGAEEAGADDAGATLAGAEEAGADDTGATLAGAEVAGADETGAAGAELAGRALQMAWAADSAARASEVLQLLRTQLVAADWMACSLAGSHWQARSEEEQEDADLTAASMQG